ncbi:sensor histidine kinase [Alkaliphilus transvaalensis]|uniref:sensor histidine kinase n=1 Tax=Alkaliphilus transvaalensis TaxID=114628 RepID=UPI00047B1260|nr:ATP-binding protein [Alkaliphilus transvaalensis]
MGHSYIILFFFYGLAFFSMGISALQQMVPKGTNFYLLKAIKYLGYFGLVHGITEWIIMIRLTNIYPDHELLLIVIATFLNALSFTFLWAFGIKLRAYKGRYEKLNNSLPWVIFTLWFLGFIFSYHYYRTDILQWLFIEDTISRYFIGLPGALMAAFALNKNANYFLKLKLRDISFKLKGMALLFLLYSIFAGIIVDKSNFYPAHLINKELFYTVFKFPVEVARASSAIGITLLFISVIDIFRWETNQKIEMLSKIQLISKERRKLGRELHDGMIQNLFATGLLVENLIDVEENEEKQVYLTQIKNSLNESIEQIRAFIIKIATQNINTEELKERLSELVATFEKNGKIPIQFNYYVSDMAMGFLSNEKVTQMYYIIQEAVSNAIKHSSAKLITITIDGNLKSVVATIVDNGIGFDIKDQLPGHYGLTSMKERAASINSRISIISSEKGTRVQVAIPWEETSNDAKRN